MLAAGICPLLLQGVMGRLLCLFVCYEKQELRRVMDGGRSDCIEERFA